MKRIINNITDIKLNIAKKVFGDLKRSDVADWLIDMIREEEFDMIKVLRRHDAITDLNLFSTLIEIVKNPSLNVISLENEMLALSELQLQDDETTNFNNIFQMIESIKSSPTDALKNSSIVSEILVILAGSSRDGTLIKEIEDIHLHIAKGHLDYLKANMDSSWFKNIQDDEYEHEENYFVMLELLRSNGSIDDSDIYYLIDLNRSPEIIEHPNGGETKKLLTILEKFPRDESLGIYNSDTIWYMSNDYFLPLIQALVKLDVDIDHNKFLIYTFAGDHDSEYELFDLLIENFTDFTQEALMSACQIVLDNIKHDPESEFENLRVIITLLKQIDSLDTVFEDSDYYYSLFGAFLEKTPKLLLSLDDISDDYIPSPSALEGIEWDSFVCEADFGEQHLITLKALTARGAKFPLEEIIEALEENEMEEFIADLKAMIK